MKKGLFSIIVLLFIACEKNEIPVPAHQSGDDLTAVAEMGQDYRNQVFFSLDQNAVISMNLKTEWDLAFEASDTGWHVRLNTSKGMAAAKMNGTFSTVSDTTGAVWKWDAQSGNADSTAVGNWQQDNNIYVIDRGYDQTGTHLGFSKFQVHSVSAVDFEISFANLDATTATTRTITKDDQYTFTYFSLTTGTTVSIAPPKTDWDICFTQYTHLFDESTPYLVSGVLLNPFETEAGFSNTISYTDITYENAQAFTRTTAANAIGYDWKQYDYDQGIYLVDPSKNYVIKTQTGFYYKLHFIDFYNESGIKGYPRFEFRRL
ncbi:MAG: HmuY family protein [Bacteroidetes bacterium]|nr:HmuY family protein [Bacteroidota bacterium]